MLLLDKNSLNFIGCCLISKCLKLIKVYFYFDSYWLIVFLCIDCGMLFFKLDLLFI